jgi:hypothetical protein
MNVLTGKLVEGSAGATSRRLVVALLALCTLGCANHTEPTAPVPGASTPGTFASDPASAELVVADVTNFWIAYDAFLGSRSTSAFQTQYLDKASPGLVDFIRVRSLTASSIADVMNAFPRYFAALRTSLQGLVNGAVSQQVRANYAGMKALYPATVYPTVTFLIGRFSTGGTTSNNRILIGSEFYGGDPGIPLDELGTFQRNNVHALSALPVIVAHEHVHILQSRAGGIFGHSTLLEQAINEGSADFVGELVSGGNINAGLRDWAVPREHALWVEFQAAMNGTDVSRWLYNQGTANADRPGDLGYFMGYRIAQAYYNRATDKAAAVHDIIEVRDAAAFMAASGYSP